MASMHAASAPARAVRTPAGDPAWLVSGYDEVRALIADSRLSWTTSAAGASRYSPAAMMGRPDAPGQNSGAGMSFAKVLARSFAPHRIQQLRPRVQQLCDDLLDELAAQTPPVDFHEAVSFPLPAMVTCEVLGVPPQDRTEFRIWSDEAACTTDRDQLHTYMAALIEDKRAHPGQDVLTDLVAAADAQGHDPQKVVVRLAAGLLFAGHETTVGAKIGLTVDSPQIQSIDDQDVGYIQAMAAPHNAAIQREAQIVQQAARGLSGANVTVLNGTDGPGDLTAGLVSQGLRIFGSGRQNLGNDAPGTAPAVRQEGDR